jgi:hypothetical protein
MTNVSINGNLHNIVPEAVAPHILPGVAAPAQAALNGGELTALTNLGGFGRADWVGNGNAARAAAYADHAGTISYGECDDDYVITDAACWNWALTGATIVNPAHQVVPAELFDLNAFHQMGSRGQFLANVATPALVALYNAQGAAIRAWLQLPEATGPQIHAKIETLARIMCALKGLTFPGQGVATRYQISVEYHANQPPNFQHWGITFDNAFSLQTLPDPDLGIWKNSQEPFDGEWDTPASPVITINVANLTLAHCERIRGILAFNSRAAPVARLIRCALCSTIHQSTASWFWAYWHRCRTCQRVYCDACGSSRLSRPRAWIIGPQVTQERTCGWGDSRNRCQGRTELIGDERGA